MKKTSFPVGINTTAVHAGEEPDPITRASAPNIVMSTTFTADADAGFSATALDENSNWIYTRWGNPTTGQLEQKLAALEGGETCVAFASGMGAISALLFDALRAGDHAIITDVGYAAMSEMTNEMLPALGISITKVDTSDTASIERALKPNTKLIYIESPCNPLMRLTDIREVVAIAHRAGAKLAVDSTFATPIATRPLELGADYVVHSLTKYLGGHGDALGGAVIGYNANLSNLRRSTAIRLGGVISPFNAWLIMRGIATFPLRMKAHDESAMKVAQFLESHSKVVSVIYPGLPSHPQHELARRQMKNFSGMLTFQVANGKEAARAFSTKLQVIHYAVSLGHHRSLLFYMPSADLLESSFKLDTRPQRESWRQYAGEGIFRLSVGLEDADDIIRDLKQVLDDL